MRVLNQQKLYRILDANINRAKEGLRVTEDICRFFLNRSAETKKLKSLRHRLTQIVLPLQRAQLLAARDAETDVGKPSTKKEFKRTNMADIFYANLQRVKESLRVLEEFLKLSDKNRAQRVKALRYDVYSLEKKVARFL